MADPSFRTPAPGTAAPGRAATRTAAQETGTERLLDLIEGLDVIVWEMDAATCRFTFVSGAAESILGYPRQRWIADPEFHATFIHPDDRERVLSGRRAALEGRDHRSEYRATTTDGRVIWLHDRVRVSPGPGGGPRLLRGLTVEITERKNAELARGESDEILRQIAGAIRDVVYLCDPHTGQYVYISPSYESVFGRSQDSLRQDPDSWMQAVHPDDRERVGAALARLAEAGYESEWREEYRIVRPDGAVRWVCETAAPIRDASGRVVKCFGCIRDITERREADRSLRESEERLREIASAIQDTVYMVSPAEARCLYVSPFYESMWGRTRESLYREPRSWLEAVHQEDRERIRQALASLAADGYARSWQEEYRVVRPDGTVRWVWDSGAPLRDASGRVRRFVGCARDITERKNWEARLREAQERFEIVARATNDAVWDWDLGTNMVRWSSGIETLFGYRPEEVHAEARWGDGLIHPADRQRVVSGMDTLIREGRSHSSYEYRFRRANGTYAHVIDRAFVLRDAQGRPVRMIGSMMDISRLKKSELALRDMSARLMRSQDEERRRIARELHDSTAQVLAALTMSLASIGKAGGKLPRTVRPRLENCSALAQQCVQELRTLSYLLHPPVLEEVGLGAAMRSYVGGFAERSGIRVDLKLPQRLGRLPDAVEMALFRIVQECLTNIHRHSESPVASIDLHQANGEVTLIIRDCGRGMGPSARRTARGSSTGVGIAGMRERVALLGGELQIQSGRHGTTVRAVLAAAPARRPATGRGLTDAPDGRAIRGTLAVPTAGAGPTRPQTCRTMRPVTPRS